MNERVWHLHRHTSRQLSDADLLQAVARGDKAALEELFERHHERVHRILARLRSVDAADVAFEVAHLTSDQRFRLVTRAS